MRDDTEMTLHISSGSILRAIFIVALCAMAWFLRDILLVLLTSVVFASAIEPITKWFIQHKVPRIPAIILIYAIIASLFGLVFYFFIPAVWADFNALASQLPKALQLELWNPLQESSNVAGTTVGDALSGAFPSSKASDVFGFAQGTLGTADIIQTFSVVFGGALSFVLIIVLSFYFAAQERGIEMFLKLVSPKKHQEYVVDLWRRSQEKIGQWFQGQIVLAVLMGVLVYLVLAILGVPNALFLALIAMIMEVIPVFGPILAAVPAVFIAFSSGFSNALFTAAPGFEAAGYMILVYFVMQQLENHLIYPQIVNKVVGVPSMVSILALIVGAKTAGFLGIVLAVPVAAILVEYLQDVAKTKNIIDA
jgi:predicted PurR-regulated permease PerM